MSIKISKQICIGCGKCLDVCPGDLIHRDETGKSYVRYPQDCWGCTSCLKECATGAMKTDGLQQVVTNYEFEGLILGIRRDEEGSRSKERVFSERNRESEWDYTNQAPELWDQFKTDFPKGNHVRVHPILHWNEIDIWAYIERENIPIIDLYFTKEGKRYRSLGCAPCTGQIDSKASTIKEIIEELNNTQVSERAGRAQDQEDAYAMQKLRKDGYM